MPIAYQINWHPVLDHKHAFLVGAWIDVWITIISFALACVLGVAIALLRTSGLKLLSWPAFVYVQLVRGVPLLVFLYWVYFGLAIVPGIAFTSDQAAIIALTSPAPRTPPRSSAPRSRASSAARARPRPHSGSPAARASGT